jgi:hypothetical protein
MEWACLGVEVDGFEVTSSRFRVVCEAGNLRRARQRGGGAGVISLFK